MNIFTRIANWFVRPKAVAMPSGANAPVGTIAPVVSGEVYEVWATSFADPADVRAFRRCKAKGLSDQECFKVGDNGVGCWGDDTTANRPMCALPPEDWKPLGKNARGARVIVVANGREVVCELRDTMPRKRNLKNGAGIDLNPAACAALGLEPPVRVRARWVWARAYGYSQ